MRRRYRNVVRSSAFAPGQILKLAVSKAQSDAFFSGDLSTGQIDRGATCHHVEKPLIAGTIDDERVRVAFLARGQGIQLGLNRIHQHVILQEHVDLGFPGRLPEARGVAAWAAARNPPPTL